MANVVLLLYEKFHIDAFANALAIEIIHLEVE
jgi:hypothetical protein